MHQLAQLKPIPLRAQFKFKWARIDYESQRWITPRPTLPNCGFEKSILTIWEWNGSIAHQGQEISKFLLLVDGWAAGRRGASHHQFFFVSWWHNIIFIVFSCLSHFNDLKMEWEHCSPGSGDIKDLFLLFVGWAVGRWGGSHHRFFVCFSMMAQHCFLFVFRISAIWEWNGSIAHQDQEISKICLPFDGCAVGRWGASHHRVFFCGYLSCWHNIVVFCFFAFQRSGNGMGALLTRIKGYQMLNCYLMGDLWVGEVPHIIVFLFVFPWWHNTVFCLFFASERSGNGTGALLTRIRRYQKCCLLFDGWAVGRWGASHHLFISMYF